MSVPQCTINTFILAIVVLLHETTGNGVLQEDRQQGEQEDEEGVKVYKRVYRR